MLSECIILAGGLGTRLRSAVPDLPKCMAPVRERPFLGYVMDYLKAQGIKRFIFSLGYMHEVVELFIGNTYPSLDIVVSLEEEPLGTGGGIRLACTKGASDTILVVNGDTLFNINTSLLYEFHQFHQSQCTLALKPMVNFERYGAVELDETQRVTAFKEKQFYKSGLINGGVYALNRPAFLAETFPEKFSFEKDYLEPFINRRPIFGQVQDEYFIDIGIPEDFQRAQTELS
jgi:D-glycero-alpha-D-manno-heptose 1-phosphate guanylyltransferase